LTGFNLAYAVTPGTFADFIEYVVPELQKRGRYWQDGAVAASFGVDDRVIEVA
jgi:hypothetical protein